MSYVPPFTVSSEAINLIADISAQIERYAIRLEQYYDAISASTSAGQSGPFIDFMLGEIYKTLKAHQGNPLPNTEDEFDEKFGKEFGVKFGVKFGVNERKVLLLLASNPSLSAGDIAEQIGLTKRGIEKQLKKFRDLGIIARKGSDKTGYWEIVKEEEV